MGKKIAWLKSFQKNRNKKKCQKVHDYGCYKHCKHTQCDNFGAVMYIVNVNVKFNIWTYIDRYIRARVLLSDLLFIKEKRHINEYFEL